MTRRAWIVVLAAAAAVAAFVLPSLLRERPGDEEQIRRLLDAAARAAEEKRVGDAVEAVSRRFEGLGLDRQGVKQLVALHVLRGTWVSVALAGSRIEVRGDVARAAVDVVLSRSGRGRALTALLPEQASVHRFQLRLAREEGGWKVTGATWRPVTLDEALAGPALPDDG